MITIKSYKISSETPTIEMPVGAKLLSSVYDDGFSAILWAEIDTEAEMEEVAFELYATGNEVSNNKKSFFQTVSSGNLVFHIYKLDPPLVDKVGVQSQVNQALAV